MNTTTTDNLGDALIEAAKAGDTAKVEALLEGDADSARELQPEGIEREGRRRSSNASWWAAEPALGRMAHGVANRVDQLRCLGNGQVPAVVRLAWNHLSPNEQPTDAADAA